MVIFLWNPRQTFTNAEINVFKKFASEGGRVVFVGEWQGYHDAITLENDFLSKMGAVMTNTSQAVDCGYKTLPQASLRPPPDHPGHDRRNHRLLLGAGARAQRLPSTTTPPTPRCFRP